MGKKNRVDLAETATEDRTLLTPTDTAEAHEVAGTGGLEYLKRVLPEASIDYPDPVTGETSRVVFDRDYRQRIIDSHKAGAMDQTAFLLADKDNAHTWDPERHRGEVTEFLHAEDLGDKAEDGPGLYARVRFPDRKAAKVVRKNPKLGVSLKLREGVKRVTGERFPIVAKHLLGTLDPRVAGLGPWRAISLSEEGDGNVVDLSELNYEELDVPKKATKDLTEDEINDALESAVVDLAEEFGDDLDLSDTDNQESIVGNTLDLAEVETLRSEILDAKVETSALRWEAERAKLTQAGVPPHVLDLAEPALVGVGGSVIDLATPEGTKPIDYRAVIRSLVEVHKGEVDLGNPEGHQVVPDELALGDDDDSDRW